MFLLDTFILLELRNAKSGGTDRGLTSWATEISSKSLYISALNLLEIEDHIAELEAKDKNAAQGLRNWLDGQVMRAFDGRIVAIDASVVQKRRGLAISNPRHALMAALALANGLTLVTKSPNDFKGSKVKVFNPWGIAPTEKVEANDWLQAAKSGPEWFKSLFIRS